MSFVTALRAFVIAGLALSAAACSTDPEALRAASDAYDSGGLLGAFVAASPEASAERKRKTRLAGCVSGEGVRSRSAGRVACPSRVRTAVGGGRGAEGRGGLRYAGKPAARHVPAHGYHGDV
jgi:hypothetical protein